MKQTGTVESTSGGSASVRVRRSSSCGDNCASCGLNCAGREMVVTAKNKIGAKAGDFVELEMGSSKVLGAAAWVYVMPLAVFIICYAAANAATGSEPPAVLIALAATAAAYAGVSIFGRKNANKYVPVIEKVIEM